MRAFEPPLRPPEPAPPEARTLARIHAELLAFRRAGDAPAEQVLERICAILSDAGYEIPGPEAIWTEQFVRRWMGDGGAAG
jgi:hypothetical protein